jgi:diguanylate cyclase (GGDEF)-like protein
VPLDPSRSISALIATARALARGTDLDARLALIAAHAADLAGGTGAAVLLLDDEAGAFVPMAAHAGGGSDGAAPAADEPLRPDDADHPLARAVRERRNVIAEGATTQIPGLGAGGGDTVLVIPMVLDDASGGQVADGVLVCVTGATPDEATMTLLGAFADLAAVAVHQTRLEHALAERADWYDRVAHTDPLTGLANRRTFDRVLELELARAGRRQDPVSIALFDVAGFEQINERRGGDTGDDILRHVAATLADSVRLVDTVARYGRDEFVVIAPGAAGRVVAQRVLDAVAALDRGEDAEPIDLRVGLALFPDDGASSAELLVSAEEALRRAKGQSADPIVAAGTAEG